MQEQAGIVEWKEDRAIFLIDKPISWTSFDVVRKLKHKLPYKKLGHAGTLDPLASGLLILCAGKRTKDIEQFQAQPKEYKGSIFLGATTPSYDLETEPENFQDISNLKEEAIRSAVETFRGQITQYPPVHSAVKIDGKRAYEAARQGKEVKMKSREVMIHEYEITNIELPLVHFRIKCSKGTYIRSLAHDLGQKLGVGGYLKRLIRTKIGDYRVEDAISPEQMVKTLSAEEK
ncbi:MAG: tRNA pseudouridine(55) synthase TruB [Cyclobacteriaceae bacterium]|nr:tRNA pseudouridine(55) synthase TruB [Cyclobacteriaceae bacterium]MCH8516698.1 tRNA pseudouridine(55) synthase TruB [Cyclobacteriaceae bacterium]